MRIEHVLAGFIPESRGRDGLALAVLLARQSGARLTVAHVHAPAWPAPGPGGTDAEWRAHVAERAARTLEQARGVLADIRDVPIEYVFRGHRGGGRGLAQLAGAAGADVVVMGSAPGGGRGHIRIGGTADQLLHASPVPVALAPRGYGGDAPPRLRRLTVAYRADPACEDAVRQVFGLAAQLDVPLRLITLVVAGGRRTGEGDMLDRLRERAAADLKAAVRGRRSVPVEARVLEGGTVATALARADHDASLLICASGEAGPPHRVFLGDVSLKIIRSAPCPVMMLPRNPPKRSGSHRKPGKP